MNSVTKVILNHSLNKNNFFIKIFAYILETLEDFDIQESNKNLSNYGLNETKGNKVSPFHKSFNKILISLKVFFSLYHWVFKMKMEIIFLRAPPDGNTMILDFKEIL